MPLPQPITPPALHELLNRTPQLWRGTRNTRTRTLASGHAPLDAALPGGGWPVGALIELLHAQAGIGELRLILPALQALQRDHRRIVFIRPPHQPYAPALACARLSLELLLFIDAPDDAQGRWAAEQALRSGAAGAVLLWSETTEDRNLRRLQLAAETGQALAFLYRSPAVLRQPSPAALRLVLEPDETDDELSETTLRVQIVKARGGHRSQMRIALSVMRPGSSTP